MTRISYVLAILWATPISTLVAGDVDAVTRGKKALESRSFTPPQWSLDAYENAWKRWTPKPDRKPAEYDRAFAAYYGLHPAPYENGRLPMGLRSGQGGKGIAMDCMICHGGSIFGKSYVGLGNSSLDLQALFEDLTALSPGSGQYPYKAANVRGTNEAFGMAEFLLSVRNPDMSLRKMPFPAKIRDQVCEDTPAWWHLAKKKTMYHTGSTDARSVRALMQFMLDPGNSRDALDKEEGTFRDIQAYLLSLKAPRYPFAIDMDLAADGQKVFAENCAKCHGAYGPKSDYPNKVIKANTIGTDPTRLDGLSDWYYEFYNESWFAKEKPTGAKTTKATGYQAPPLDGIWATAPYFHNGSVPTLYHVLNSKARPKLFTRSYTTDEKAFDEVNVGWKVDVLNEVPNGLSAQEGRRIYDTTKTGRGNGGHTFGDAFSEDERRAVIEYLKSL